MDATLPGGLVAARRPLDPAAGTEAPWVDAWRRLGGAPLAANPFYEADYALSAAPAFGAGVELLLIADRAPEAAGARLVAAWPFRRLRARWGLPLPVLMGWTHGFCPFGAPLLDGEDPEQALAGLLAAPCALGLAPRLLMPNAPMQGPFADLLARTGTRAEAYWPHARAVLDIGGLGPAERAAYLDHMSGKRRRKLRLARARMEAAAPVVLETVREPEALAAALEEYVALETAGWKGRAGTALGNRPREAAFMRAMAARLGAQGRLRIDRLRRDGRTLAAAILPLTGDEAWFLKISYDEAEAADAPGVQLVHRLTETLLREGGLARLDSCAAPDYRLAEMFWTGRRTIAHTLIEGGGGDRLFPLAAGLERARERVSKWRAARRAGAPG